jgi:ATP-dependent Clp protease ATP-binding subunit ClpC
LIGQGGERAGGILIGAGADLGRTRREVDRLLGGRIVLSSARNLTQAAIDGELDPVIGRDREIDRLLHVLFRSSSNIPMLVGRTGVGKTSVVYGLAQRIAANKVPEAFAGIQVFQLNVRTAVQRAKTRDEFDGLISRMLPENLTWRDALLFLDDEQLLQFPLPVKLRIIGATKKSHMLSGIFIPIAVEEISVQQTIQILESRRDRIQERYQVIVADRALEAVAQYAKERLDGPLPGSAFDLLDEAASLGYVRGLGLIDEMTVAEAVAGMLGVAPERVKTAPRVRAPTGRVEHDPEIWEMS